MELEPQIRALALEGAAWQGQVQAERKADTGDDSTDVVSAADRWLQRGLLQLFLDHELQDCALVAEEWDPELASLCDQFAPAGAEHVLLLDPLDGTRRFLEGEPYFATVLTLQRGEEQRYTFACYPRLDWWVRMIGGSSWACSGHLQLPAAASAQPDTVVYTSGNPKDSFDDWQLNTPGLRWLPGSALHASGSKLLYLAGAVAGYASCNPNVYDGLMIYHYARTRRHQLREESPGRAAQLDLAERQEGPRGIFTPGRYLCLWPRPRAGAAQ